MRLTFALLFPFRAGRGIPYGKVFGNSFFISRTVFEIALRHARSDGDERRADAIGLHIAINNDIGTYWR